jgi:hypothetical protein
MESTAVSKFGQLQGGGESPLSSPGNTQPVTRRAARRARRRRLFGFIARIILVTVRIPGR